MSQKKKEDIKRDAIEWYTANRPTYKLLCQKVESIIKEILETEGVSIHTTTARAKEITSFSQKIEDPKYDTPQEQIKDLAGIRIIAYVESDLVKINQLIEDAFDIDPLHSLNKADELGIDKVGYKSVHYVATLKRDRLALPEYNKFKGLYFEIQIRTILQHAWAEIEHDKNYKFSGKLDYKIQRRFKILAGLLELADREFDSLAAEIDKIAVHVEEATRTGELDIEINSTTLKSYLLTRFDELFKKGLNPNFPTTQSENQILQELTDFGIKTLQDLNQIVPKDYEANRIKVGIDTRQNLVVITRNIMMINNHKKYFSKCWKKNYPKLSEGTQGLLRLYNISPEEIKKEFGIDLG